MNDSPVDINYHNITLALDLHHADVRAGTLQTQRSVLHNLHSYIGSHDDDEIRLIVEATRRKLTSTTKADIYLSVFLDILSTSIGFIGRRDLKAMLDGQLQKLERLTEKSKP